MTHDFDDDRDLDVLRSVRVDTTPDPDALARVRSAVVRPARPAHRAWLAAAASVAAASVAAVGLAVALIAPQFPARLATPTPDAVAAAPAGAPTGTSAATVELFAAEAATALRAGTPLAPDADEYLKIARTGTGNGAKALPPPDGAAVPEWATRTSVTLYVPGDTAKGWVRVDETWNEPKNDAAQRWLATHPEDGHVVTTERARDGAFTEPWDGASWTQPTQAWLQTLPADADQLLASASGHHDGLPVDHDAVNLLNVLIEPMLQTEVRDADLRAAMFEAIGKVDSIQVLPELWVGDQVGTGLKAVSSETADITLTVVFDTTSYRPIGLRFANGADVIESQFHTSIVDTAP